MTNDSQQEVAIPDAWRDFATRLMDFVREAPVDSGVCCCGDSIEGHADGMYCGHTPVDQWSYALMSWREEFEKLSAESGSFASVDGSVRQLARKDARDAARYRWLREHKDLTLCVALFGYGLSTKSKSDVDEAIDDRITRLNNATKEAANDF